MNLAAERTEFWSVIPKGCGKESASTPALNTLWDVKGEAGHPPSAPQLIRGHCKGQRRTQSATS